LMGDNGVFETMFLDVLYQSLSLWLHFVISKINRVNVFKFAIWISSSPKKHNKC
jgi:hypothetical protein